MALDTVQSGDYAFLPGASKLYVLSSVDVVYNKVKQKNIVFIFKGRQGEV